MLTREQLDQRIGEALRKDPYRDSLPSEWYTTNRRRCLPLQEWAIGQVVNVGFIKNLTIVDRVNGEWVLESPKGVRYSFLPHSGLCRLN